MQLSIGSSGEPAGGCRSFGGKLVGTLFFAVFFLMGALFVVVILGEALEETAPWFWSPTPCTIISSGVEETGDDQNPYRPVVSYVYDIDGRAHRGDQLSRTVQGSASFDRARDRAARYPPGIEASCRVDPDHPALSVLERRIPWIALMVFLPLIFVAVGGGGLYFLWRRAPSAEDKRIESISQNAKPGRGRLVMLIIGLIFTVVGALVFTFLFGLPALRLARAATWEKSPCTIVASTIRSWSTDDGTAFRADVHYEYSVGGRKWRSNRVDFFSALSSGRDQARAVRDRYPVGSTQSCWVDPGGPSRSVLDRNLRPKHLLGLLPLVFLVAGLALLAHGRKLEGRSPPEIREPSPQPAGRGFVTEPEPRDGPIFLEPRWSPVGKVLGSLLFALFWNGIVSVFVYQAWQSWERGQPDWFLSIFMVPFVLVGLASFVFVGHFVLALANPRPRLRLAGGSPRLGETLHVDWSFTGRASRIHHLEIILEGREEATYRRGTDTHTDREVFTTLTLVDTANDWEIPRGTAGLPVPDDSMHSFSGANNKIVWEIKVVGEISRWPDVNQNFPVTVQPLRVEDL